MSGIGLRQVVYTTARKNVKRDVRPNGMRRVDFEDRHPVIAYGLLIAVVVAGVFLLSVM